MNNDKMAEMMGRLATAKLGLPTIHIETDDELAAWEEHLADTRRRLPALREVMGHAKNKAMAAQEERAAMGMIDGIQAAITAYQSRKRAQST